MMVQKSYAARQQKHARENPGGNSAAHLRRRLGTKVTIGAETESA